MRARWVVALLAVVAVMDCSASPHRQNRFEATSQFLFRRNHIPTPCERAQEPQTGLGWAIVPQPGGPAHTVRRTDRMTIPVAELSAFSMSLQGAMAEVTGDTSDNYSVQSCDEAGAASESDAKALLDKIQLTRDDKMVSASVPPYVAGRIALAYVQVKAPREAPISIHGDYASVRVIGMKAPVRVSTTHARITLLDTTGDVDARAESFGIIDFSADRGQVCLDAATEINLSFPGQYFDGSLDAKSAGAVRVLLPSGFASPFEATVRRKSDFACRADVCEHAKPHKRDGKFVFTIGAGEPALHFASVDGPIVVDSVDRLPAYNGLR